MTEVEFIADFADKKKGDRFICDSSLASTLIRVDKVAKLYEAETEPKKKAKK